MANFKTPSKIQLNYQTYGSKENDPLVLIHGLGAEGNMWWPQINSFPDQGLYLIVPDMRGHGQTSAGNGFSIQGCAGDIRDLLDHLEVESAHVAGVSMGGVIAQQFACDFPNRVNRLIIADSFSEVSSLGEKLGGWMQWLTMKTAPSLMLRSLQAAYKGEDKKQTLHYFQQTYKNTDHRQLLRARAALNRFRITHRLPGIKTPVKILVGDGFGKFAIRMGQKTADAIPHARMKVLPGGMDPSNLVVPVSFNKEVIHFINQ